MGRVIAISNQKGGVGKTTTAINLGAALAAQNSETLLVDCDPQANATGGLGFAKDPARRSLYHALVMNEPITELVLESPVKGLHVIPSDRNLVGAAIELVEHEHRENLLAEKLRPLRERFSYLLLDCPPALDLLTLNALVAADSVLIPIQCEYFALEGVTELFDTLLRVRRSYNPRLSVEGILLTMYDERTNLSHQVRDELKGFFGEQVLKTFIPRNVRLAEAPSHGKPIFAYDPACLGAKSYLALAKEVMQYDQKGAGTGA